jgi:hypothetical protein
VGNRAEHGARFEPAGILGRAGRRLDAALRATVAQFEAFLD